jgi:hypothetical protein
LCAEDVADAVLLLMKNGFVIGMIATFGLVKPTFLVPEARIGFSERRLGFENATLARNRRRLLRHDAPIRSRQSSSDDRNASLRFLDPTFQCPDATIVFQL